MGDRKKKRKRVWAGYMRKQDIPFYRLTYPVMVVVGSVARFFYRLRHWDWRDWTPPPEPPLAEIVADFGAPVYGLLDDFMELLPDGRSYGGAEIGLNYQRSWLVDEEAKPGVRIETRKRDVKEEPWAWLAFQVRMAAHSAAFEFSSRTFRETEMAKDHELTEFLGDYPMEALNRVRVRVPGFPETKTIWRWNVAEPVHVALLRNAITELMVSSFGFTDQQFQELTSHIGVINDRPDLMYNYREQADARVKEYQRRLLEGEA